MLSKQLTRLNKLYDKQKLDILTVPTHEGYQSLLSKTGHNFYMLSGPGLKTWDFHTRKLPENHFIYNLPYDKIRGSERFDLILCQNRIQQWDILNAVSQNFDIPVIVLDHTEPPPGIKPQDFEVLSQRIGHVNVYITEHNRNSWGNLSGKIVPHGIDTEVFKPIPKIEKQDVGISLVNHFAQRDIFCGWTLWKEIVKEVPVHLVGENPGLSQSVNDPSALNILFNSAKFFLNTSQYSPVPLSMLEAMAAGVPVVTTAKQEIPKIIQNGENGFISNDPGELIKYCHQLREDESLRERVGMAGRQTIMEHFSMNSFMQNWNNIFNEALK